MERNDKVRRLCWKVGITGRKDANGEQIFVQSGWNIMTEQDTEGRRTYYTGSSSQSNNGEGANFFLFNHRGDTIAVSDKDGNILNEFYYEAYGKVTNQSGTPVNSLSETTLNLFVGAYGIRYDRKTELSYMRFRWYGTSYLRFLNSDCLLQINRYSYVNCNAVNFIDPFGLKQNNIDTIDNVNNIGYTGAVLSMNIYILLNELEQMEQNDINATGYDLSMNYSLPNGYTQSVGGFGYQIIFPKGGGVHFYNYYQYGAGISQSGGLNAGISRFVVILTCQHNSIIYPVVECHIPYYGFVGVQVVQSFAKAGFEVVHGFEIAVAKPVDSKVFPQLLRWVQLGTVCRLKS